MINREGVRTNSLCYMLLQDPHVPLSVGVQHKFIAFAGYLHHKGLATLVADIYKAVEIVLRGYVFAKFGYSCERTNSCRGHIPKQL